MTTLTWQRHTGHASSYDVVDAGFNYRLDELRAALALVQLGRLEDANGRAEARAPGTATLLDGVEGVTFAFDGSETTSIRRIISPSRCSAQGVYRDDVRAQLARRADPDERPLSAHPPLHVLRRARQTPAAARRPTTSRSGS